MHVLLLIEIIDHRRIFAGERLEALFPARVRQATAIEGEAAAIARFVLGQFVVKRKTEDADNEIVGFGGDALQLF